MEKSWPGDLRHPTIPTIAYTSSSTVYMRNCKPGSGGRVTRLVRQGDPAGQVSSPSRVKSCHAEHAYTDISVP